MLDPTNQPMRQWNGKQEPAHGNQPRATPPQHPAHPPAVAPHGDRGADDLACGPDRGTTPHPATATGHAHELQRSILHDSQSEKTWLTLADVAEHLDVSTRTVMRWVERGQFPAVLLPGGRKRIHRDAFHVWLASLPTAGGGT